MGETAFNETREELRNYLKSSKKITQTAVAKQIGYSGTVLSQFLSGTYTGNNEEFAEKARQFLLKAKDKAVLTHAPNIALNVCNTADILSKIGFVHLTGDILFEETLA